jgi:hypothetical protein
MAAVAWRGVPVPSGAVPSGVVPSSAVPSGAVPSGVRLPCRQETLVREVRRPEVPVFLLSTARTESRLLRTVLATHPELGSVDGSDAACAVLARIMRVSGNLYRLGSRSTLYVTDILRARRDGADGHVLPGPGPGPGPGAVPAADLDAFVFADILAGRWPATQFVCLTRHYLDVLADSAEAVRWAATAAGLDPAPFPDLTVIARAWLASAQALLAHREAYPERCLEIRHADVACADPMASIARLLDFFGVAQDWSLAGLARLVESPGSTATFYSGSGYPGSGYSGSGYSGRPLPVKLSREIDEALVALGYDPVDWATSDVSL